MRSQTFAFKHRFDKCCNLDITDPQGKDELILASKTKENLVEMVIVKLSLNLGTILKEKSGQDIPGHGKNRSKALKRKSREYIFRIRNRLQPRLYYGEQWEIRLGKQYGSASGSVLHVALRQQFSRGQASQGTLAISGDTVDCHNWGCYWHLLGRGCKRFRLYSVSTGKPLLGYVFLDSYCLGPCVLLHKVCKVLLCKSPSGTV